jgi:hypothetical protein
MQRLYAPLAILVGLWPAVVPAYSDGTPGGVYTYRYGYNPGYYGCSKCPLDTGAKPGQAMMANHLHYRLFNGRLPTKPANGVRPPGTR